MHKMTRAIALVLLLAAVVLAALAFTSGKRDGSATVTQAGAAAPTQRETVSVVVAAGNLPAGQQLAAGALKVEQWPSRPADGFSNVEALQGAIPLLQIPAGVAITRGALAQGVALQLKPGERALAVPVDELAGAGNRIVPGDYVDVFISLKQSQPNNARSDQLDNVQTRLLLSRLRVLAYGSDDLADRDKAANSNQPAGPASVGASGNASADSGSSRRFPGSSVNRGSDENNPKPPAHTAVLAVPVQLTDRLLLGAQNGKLALALRHPTDEGAPDASLFPTPRSVLSPRNDLSAEARGQLDTPENRAFAGIDMPALVGDRPAPPKPVQLRRASAPATIEIIRGSQPNARPTSL